DRIADGRGSAGNVFAANSSDGGRGLDAESGQALILGNLGNLELKGALAVDDGAPMSRKPCEHGGGVLGRVAMPARVRGCAHAIVEDSLGRSRGEINKTAVEKPLRKRYVYGSKLASQRLDPGRILVKHKDARLSQLAGGERHAYFLVPGARD